MWFKQAKIYQLSDDFPIDQDMLEQKLGALTFQPCLPSLPYGYGWSAPADGGSEDAPLVHSANGYLLICLQLEEKLLPAMVVRREVDEKVKEIKSAQDRKVSRKEKLDLKDEITRTLLPRAFSKYSPVYALIDIKNRWLITSTSSKSKLDKLSELLKKTFNDNIIQPLPIKKVASTLTNWLLDEAYPSNFGIEDACLLCDPSQQTRTIRCKQQDLFNKSIQSLIGDGFEISQLALNWLDRVSFILADDFTLKSIRYHDEVKDLAKEQYLESAQQQFDADFFIMTETLSALLNELVEAFQIEKEPTT